MTMTPTEREDEKGCTAGLPLRSFGVAECRERPRGEGYRARSPAQYTGNAGHRSQRLPIQADSVAAITTVTPCHSIEMTQGQSV